MKFLVWIITAAFLIVTQEFDEQVQQYVIGS